MEIPSNSVYCRCGLQITDTSPISGTYRVMLNEGSTAEEWCPPGLTSVSELETVTAGKNLADMQISNVAVPYTLVMLCKTPLIAGETYTLYFDCDPAWNGYVNENITTSYTSTNAVDGHGKATFTLKDPIPESEYSPEGYLYFVKSGGSVSVAPNFENIQLELGSSATAYEPPHVTTTPIDLAGRELRSLPDGTCDVLTWGADGTRSIGVNAHSELWDGVNKKIKSFENGYGYASLDYACVSTGTGTTKCLMVDTLPIGVVGMSDENLAQIGGAGYISFCIQVAGCDSVQELNDWLQEHPTTIVYTLAEPQTVDLAPVPMVAQPSTTLNVWADADDGLSPEVEATYERDLTIAYDNLASKVAALTVAQATN